MVFIVYKTKTILVALVIVDHYATKKYQLRMTITAVNVLITKEFDILIVNSKKKE